MPPNDSQNIAVIAAQVRDIHHRLFGNGQPGVIARIEDQIESLEKGHSEWLKSHDVRLEIAERGHWKVAVIVGIVVGILNFAIPFFHK